VIGVFDAALTPLFAEVLCRLGCERAFVVHGRDGMDELTTTTTSQVSELRGGEVETYEFDPLAYIGSYALPADLAGGDAAENAAITRDVLAGKAGAPRDIVCLNAATAIVAGNGAEDVRGGWIKACESIDSGRAAGVLERLVALTA
jgi:anthranilate phosphoribosyltransferase